MLSFLHETDINCIAIQGFYNKIFKSLSVLSLLQVKGSFTHDIHARIRESSGLPRSI